MAIEQNIRLSLFSEITDAESGEREREERVLSAVLREKDGCRLLSYTETGEGGDVRSELFCTDGRVRLRRTGSVRSEILFSEGTVHSSLYEIPPYRFDMTVTTERLHCFFGATDGEIDLAYTAVIGGVGRHCRLTLRIAVCRP